MTEPTDSLFQSFTSSREPVYLIDGTALVYRAHFAFLRNPLVTSKGEVVSAIYGFASALFQLLRRDKPVYMAVAFDMAAPTFRHEQYAAYKANRPELPGELVPQLPRVRQLVDALGLQVLEQKGIEADDLIGSMARLAREQGHDVVIVSADKDFMQLVSEGVRQWIPPTGGGDGQWIDPAAVKEKWGVQPDQMVELLALMGDASDNIPGVAGIGPKTAAQLLEQFGSLDGIYGRLNELGKKAVRTRLEVDRESAYLSRELVTIRTDLPPPCPIEALRVPEISACKQLAPLLHELEFQRMLETLGLQGDEVWNSQVRILNTPEALAEVLARWSEARPPLALDVLTEPGSARTALPLGISFSWEPGHPYFIPLGHLEGRNLDRNEVRSQLALALGDPQVTLWGQNLKSALHSLGGMGIPAPGPLRDALLAAYLIDPESAQPNLEALCQEYLQHRMIPRSELLGRGRTQQPLNRSSIDRAAEFSGEDADVSLRLAPLLEARLEKQGSAELWRDLECPLLRVLLKMEQAGVRVDTEMLAVLSVSMQKDLERLTEEIHRLAGMEFNIGSPAQLADVLFRELRLPSRKKTKTGLSTDQEVLEELAGLHPVVRLVLEHRSLTKLKGTYIDALPQLVDSRTGRIHATFNQMVAATGRLSSSDPNLQNIPIRTAQGREIRRAFVAEAGNLLVSADYSQIELRILAHLSRDEGLLEAFRNHRDVHAATAERVFGVPPGLVDSAMRARAKTVNFGVIYGMGAQRLARELSIPFQEAKRFIEAYFAQMPGVKGYMDQSLARARAQGYVTTLFGRRRTLRGLDSPDSRLRSYAERVAANTPIQGSAADLIKRAMLSVDRELEERGLRARLILQVHDELVLETPADEVPQVESLLVKSMEGAASLLVPLSVEVGRGRSWAEAHG